MLRSQSEVSTAIPATVDEHVKMIDKHNELKKKSVEISEEGHALKSFDLKQAADQPLLSTELAKDLKSEIEEDLRTTFIENLDLLRMQEGTDDCGSNIAWKSSVESINDDADALLFYQSHFCSERQSEEEVVFLSSELLDAPLEKSSLSNRGVDGVMKSPQATDIPSPVVSSLVPVSFSHLKPLSRVLKHNTSDTTATTTATDASWSFARFREYQAEQWAGRFEELKQYAEVNGHCQISHRDLEHDSLARWSKRQRYQYKLLQDGKPSTMTLDRVAALKSLGFAFNAHEAVWFHRLDELKEFLRVHGHCNVPSNYDPNQKLSTWVKCQRRQHKLLVAGRRSNMTWPRVKLLEDLGFVWEVRPHGETH